MCKMYICEKCQMSCCKSVQISGVKWCLKVAKYQVSIKVTLFFGRFGRCESKCQKWRLKPTKRVAGNGDLTWNHVMWFVKYVMCVLYKSVEMSHMCKSVKSAFCAKCQNVRKVQNAIWSKSAKCDLQKWPKWQMAFEKWKVRTWPIYHTNYKSRHEFNIKSKSVQIAFYKSVKMCQSEISHLNICEM